MKLPTGYLTLPEFLENTMYMKPTLSTLALLPRLISFLLTICMTGALAVAAAESGNPKNSGEWTHFGTLMQGGNFDAAVTEEGTLFFFGSESRIVDQNGVTLWQDSRGDTPMTWISQAPAVSVDNKGGLHAVSRGEGNHSRGYELFYQYRPKNGVWGPAIQVSGKLPRNYCVGVAGIDEDLAYVVFSEKHNDNVWGRVNLAAVENGEVTRHGSTHGFRIDNILDFRIAGGQYLYLAIGNNSPSGRTFYHTTAVKSTPGQTYDALKNSRQRFEPPSGRRGFPRLFPNTDGSVDMTMGSQTGNAFWARSGTDGSLSEDDFIRVFDDLGEWHLSIGISAAATLPGTETVLAAAVRSNGEKSGQGPLVAKLSRDGGKSWQAEMKVADAVRAGEGRGRIKVMATGNSFFVAYPAPGEEGTVELSRYTVELPSSDK